MFDIFGTNRLTEWKKFRDELEDSETPIEDVLALWSKAPIVNPYLNPRDSDSWPDPWHLIIDDQFDDLAIALGIVYTLKLTERFMDDSFEIHMSIFHNEKYPRYYLRIKNIEVDVASRSIMPLDLFQTLKNELIWSSKI